MRIKIPNFNPIGDFKDDKLGFQNAAVRLQMLLSDIETPNTFGIYGVWGSGKTSLMKLTQKVIDDTVEHNKVATVWFDAWKYEYEKDVPIVYPLLFEIQKKLNKGSLKDFIKKKGKFLGKFIGTSILASSTTPIKLLSGGTVDRTLKDISDDIDVATEVFFSNYENWAANLDRFQKEFEIKLSETLKQNKLEKLYIFIDDMDRCLPENAVQLLETMKNYLSVKSVLFVIGVDKRIITSHVNSKYGNESNYGDEYLTKIIPLSITLPSKNPLEIVKNILEKLGEKDVLTNKEIQLMGSYLELFCSSNRRLVNTVIHKFLVVLSYVNLPELLKELNEASRNEFCTVEQCRMGLLRWILIQELYPKIFQEYEWPREFQRLIDKTPEVQPVHRIANRWSTSDTSNVLVPPIQANVANILNQYINDGLFK